MQAILRGLVPVQAETEKELLYAGIFHGALFLPAP